MRLVPGRGGPQVNGTGPAAAVGGVAISGYHTGDITVQGAAMPHSEYLRQVQRLAPPTLLDRERELTDLAEFCASPRQSGCYRWMRAPAWAGKTALMSWFVLHPPPGVRIVSFFVTARIAGQSDRLAFIDVVLEQLAELLTEPLPVLLTDATRDGHLLDMLSRAAHVCRQRRERLVLVVDGLDEDAGVTTAPDSYSIAALLPAEPDNGMRVLVAGRPNPAVPADVPDNHPLRDPAILWPLAASPHAAAVRVDAQRELKRLLHGTPADQDLLGLLTAAGGGLSCVDLSELTGRSVLDVDEQLGAVSGRTFLAQAGQWQPATRVYVLGHEELHQQAIGYLRPKRLDAFRQQLHAWADRYRCRRWPPETPEYLLAEYFRMLHVAGDLPRMIGCACDGDRHDRLLAATGGDAAALGEINTLSEMILTQKEPNLDVLARLAVHRATLNERNTAIPVRLPSVWARLGNLHRAEALAQSVTGGRLRVQAMAGVALAFAATGQLQRAESLAHATADLDFQGQVIGRVARGWIDANELGRAEDLARCLSSPQQSRWVSEIVADLAASGHGRQAEALARTIADPADRANALCGAARALASHGDTDHARLFATHAESAAGDAANRDRQTLTWVRIAHAWAHVGDMQRADIAVANISDAEQRTDALVLVAGALVDAGDLDRGREYAADAAVAAASISGPHLRGPASARVARALANAGDAQRAEAVAGAIDDPYRRARALVWVARAAATVDPDAAGSIAARAEAVAGAIPEPDLQGKALAKLATAWADLGRMEQAETLARRIADPTWRDTALMDVACGAVRQHGCSIEGLLHAITEPARRAAAFATVADGLAAAGDGPGARHLCEVATTLADAHGDASWRAQLLTDIAHALVTAGDRAPAEAMALRAVAAARAAAGSAGHGPALARVAGALARAGNDEHARVIVEQAVDAASAATDVHLRGQLLSEVAKVLAEAGQPQRGEAVARTIDDQFWRAAALTEVVRATAQAGDSRAAETVSRTIDQPQRRAQAMADVAGALADAGDVQRAATVADGITDPYWQARALMHTARARGGDAELIRGLTEQAERVARRITNPYRRARTLIELCVVLAKIGNVEHAQTLRYTLSEPGWQAHALTGIAQAVAAARDPDHAEDLAQGISTPHLQAKALAAIARRRVDANHAGRAAQLANQAVRLADTVTDPDLRAQTLGDVLPTLALATDPHQAEQLAASITDLQIRAQTLADIARVQADKGEVGHAQTLTRRAEDALGAVPDTQRHVELLVEIAVRVGLAGGARRLLARALHLGHWSNATTALLELQPSAIASIADTLLYLISQKTPPPMASNDTDKQP